MYAFGILMWYSSYQITPYMIHSIYDIFHHLILVLVDEPFFLLFDVWFYFRSIPVYFTGGIYIFRWTWVIFHCTLIPICTRAHRIWVRAVNWCDTSERFFPWVSNSQAWMPITKIARKRIQCFVYEICIERKKHRMLTDTYQSMYRMASHLWFNLLLDFAGGFYFARKCMEQFPHVWFNKHVYTFRIKEAKSIRKISLANRRQ